MKDTPYPVISEKAREFPILDNWLDLGENYFFLPYQLSSLQPPVLFSRSVRIMPNCSHEAIESGTSCPSANMFQSSQISFLKFEGLNRNKIPLPQ